MNNIGLGDKVMKFIVDQDTVRDHEKYLQIMEMAEDSTVDFATDSKFQRLYSGYYFPSPIKKSFKDSYFSYMQQCRNDHPSFRTVLEHLYQHSEGAVHFSFASKLLHTVNRDEPVLDRHIMRLMGFDIMHPQVINPKDKDFTEKKEKDTRSRMDYYDKAFSAIKAEYENYRNEPFMLDAIEKFDAMFANFKSVSYMKKVDLLLFRLRQERGASMLDYLCKAF